MQKIPSLYGFSIITLVLVLMVINHFVYLRILENSVAQIEPSETTNEQQQNDSVDTVDEAPMDNEGSTQGGLEEALEGSSLNPENNSEAGE